MNIKALLNSKEWKLYCTKNFWIFRVFSLCVIVLTNYSCNSCHDGLHVNNGEYEVVNEKQFDIDEEEYLKNLHKIAENNSNSIVEEATLKEIEKSNPQAYQLLRNFTLVLHESDEEAAEYYDAYWEVIGVAKKRKSLQAGWFNHNEDMEEGFETGKFLGVVSNREDYFAKHSNVIKLIDRVDSFERFFKYRNQQFLSGALGSKEFIDSLDDFANYASSLIMVRSMLETKRPDGSLRYVEDGTPSINNKDRISAKVAKKLIDKINKFLYKIEKFQVSESEDLTMLATPTNIIASKAKLEKLPKLIGGSLDPEIYNPDELSMVYKKKLIPGSVLWTWLNSRSLRDGSWNSLIKRPSSGESIVQIMHDLNILNLEYLRIINEMQDICKREDHNGAERKILELFTALKNNPQFTRIHKNGKKAINLTREILAKKEYYRIGRPSGKTLGLKYAGNWRKDDSSKQILEVDGRALIDSLDIMSGVAVLIDSNMSMKTSLSYSKLIRSAIRSVSKNPNDPDTLWFRESVEEQTKRESEQKSSLSRWIGLLVILTGISAFFPPLLPITITLLAVKVGLAIALFKA